MVYFSFSFMDLLHGYYFSGNEWYLIFLGISDLTWGFLLQFYLQIKTMYWIPNKKELFSHIVMSPKEAATSSELPCSYYISYLKIFSLLKVDFIYFDILFSTRVYYIWYYIRKHYFYSYESIMWIFCALYFLKAWKRNIHIIIIL